jgi:hypothetical protein
VSGENAQDNDLIVVRRAGAAAKFEARFERVPDVIALQREAIKSGSPYKSKKQSSGSGLTSSTTDEARTLEGWRWSQDQRVFLRPAFNLRSFNDHAVRA